LKVSELPDVENPKFKLIHYGAERLSNSELLLVLTGATEYDTANKILAESKQELSLLRKMTVDELVNVDGVGESTACKVIAAAELGVRIAAERPYGRQRIFESADVYKMLGTEFIGEKQEIITALFLNTKFELIGREAISKGGMVSAHIEPRDIFRAALKRSSPNIILAHNHPSGDPKPSEDDIYATKRISQCGELIGITVVDHIILGQGRYESMRNLGFMEFGDTPNSLVADKNDIDRGRER